MEVIKVLESLVSEALGEDELFNPGASEEEISEIEEKLGCKLPQEVKELYLTANGQVEPLPLINGYWFNSLEELCESFIVNKEAIASGDFEDCESEPVGPVKALYFHEKWIPIFNSDSDNLSVDLDPDEGGSVGQVVEVLSDEEVRAVLAVSIEEFIGKLVEKIKSGDLKYNDEYEYFMSTEEEDTMASLFGISA